MHTFDIVMLIILAVAVIAIVAFDVLAQKKKSGEMTLETATDIAMSVISRVAFSLITDAERQYGSGTGELKMSACVAKLIDLLPEAVVELVPEKTISEQLEKALEIAKNKWEKNPRLLNSAE